MSKHINFSPQGEKSVDNKRVLVLTPEDELSRQADEASNEDYVVIIDDASELGYSLEQDQADQISDPPPLPSVGKTPVHMILIYAFIALIALIPVVRLFGLLLRSVGRLFFK